MGRCLGRPGNADRVTPTCALPRYSEAQRSTGRPPKPSSRRSSSPTSRLRRHADQGLLQGTRPERLQAECSIANPATRPPRSRPGVRLAASVRERCEMPQLSSARAAANERAALERESPPMRRPADRQAGLACRATFVTLKQQGNWRLLARWKRPGPAARCRGERAGRRIPHPRSRRHDREYGSRARGSRSRAGAAADRDEAVCCAACARSGRRGAACAHGGRTSAAGWESLAEAARVHRALSTRPGSAPASGPKTFASRDTRSTSSGNRKRFAGGADIMTIIRLYWASARRRRSATLPARLRLPRASAARA